MKSFSSLDLGYIDAINYLKKEKKDLFNRFFYKDSKLDDILLPSTCFILGEKGTGKTAYAVYLSNNEYKNTRSILHYIKETDYNMFIKMKQDNMLNYSDYSSIWRVILCLLIMKDIVNHSSDIDKNVLSKLYDVFNINKLIDDYYDNAFSPEILSALKVISSNELRGSLASGDGNINALRSLEKIKERQSFQVELVKLLRKFTEAVGKIKLNKNIIIFIDGIDIRPGNVSYNEYLECVKGLVDAVWNLNISFQNVKDTRGYFKVVLLLRPDIFNSSGLQNLGNKVADNSVVLDWRTTYPEYRKSDIFKMIDRLLNVQQDEIYPEGSVWDAYFPWKKTSTSAKREYDDSFISFLRISYSRPRDIIAALKFIQKDLKVEPAAKPEECKKYMDSLQFRKNYSDYLLSTIKDQTSFYFSDEDYDIFISFFDFINNTQFTWDEYCAIFDKFIDNICEFYSDIPEFCKSKEYFLQFLYEVNTICYIEDGEDETFFRWCYRERETSRLQPKVKFKVRYGIHYGLWKALNVGHQKIMN